MIIKGKHVYENVLSIPEGTSGAFSIKHHIAPAGKKFSTTTFRTAMHAGHKNKSIVFDHDTRWHYLLEDGATWMADLPIEQMQHDATLTGYHGRVLVGGLGLGYAVKVLSAKPRVKSIVIVEQSKDVISLVYPHVATPKTAIIHEDLHAYLASHPTAKHYAFDWGFYDIWQADGEGTFHEVVMPLRSASRGKVQHVRCWNEDVMRGQLLYGLHSRLLWMDGKLAEFFGPRTSDPTSNLYIPTLDQLADGLGRDNQPEHSVWVQWSRPYWRWYRRTRPDFQTALYMASDYAMYYGTGNEFLSLCLGETVLTYLPKEDDSAQTKDTPATSQD